MSTPRGFITTGLKGWALTLTIDLKRIVGKLLRGDKAAPKQKSKPRKVKISAPKPKKPKVPTAQDHPTPSQNSSAPPSVPTS